jgi:hypothetical protein
MEVNYYRKWPFSGRLLDADRNRAARTGNIHLVEYFPYGFRRQRLTSAARNNLFGVLGRKLLAGILWRELEEGCACYLRQLIQHHAHLCVRRCLCHQRTGQEGRRKKWRCKN